MDIALHENGPWHTDNGSMLNRASNVMLDEDVSVLVTIDDSGYGILHKVGRTEPLQKYMDNAVSRLTARGDIDLANEWRLLTFHIKNDELGFAPDGYNFNIDEICTLINWFNNSIGEEMSKFLSLSVDEAKNKLASLQRIGF